MAGKGKTDVDVTGAEGISDGAQQGENGERTKVSKEMRPMYSEIARLSATLGMARGACYTGDTAKALKALQLLARQLPLAIDMAEIMAPGAE